MAENLTLLLADYRAGIADFEANAPRGSNDEAIAAYINKSFGPALERLQRYDGAARSADEALLALNLADEQLEPGSGGDAGLARRMVKAANLYLREVCVG